MSMVSSYTLLSRAPPLCKISSTAPMQNGKPPAVLPRMLRKQSSRAPLSVCHAQNNDKHTYEIQPFALVHPKFPPTSGDHWTITEDADRINLWFFVERTTKKEQLQVLTDDDVLLVRFKGDGSKDDKSNPARQLDVRLLIPPGYDKSKVEAELAFGSLLVTVTKPKHDPIGIAIGDKAVVPASTAQAKAQQAQTQGRAQSQKN